MASWQRDEVEIGYTSRVDIDIDLFEQVFQASDECFANYIQDFINSKNKS